MFHKKSEKGQALVIIALAAVGLFAFTALAIDGGMVYSDKRHAQNAADTAVLASALARIRGKDYSAAGLNRASSNGYANDADSTVEIHLCSDTGITCEGMPAGAVASEYIQVKITSIVHMTFARLVGRQTLTNIVTAIARAKIGIPGPLFEGAALAALSPTDPQAIWGNGNVTLDINNGGVFDNSNNTCAFQTTGTAGSYTLDPGFNFSVVGGYCQSGSPTITGSFAVPPPLSIDYPPTITNIPVPNISCMGLPTGYVSGQTVYPGNFAASPALSHGTYTFTPGTYCFNGGVDVHGSVSISLGGDVNFVITSGAWVSNAVGDFLCNNYNLFVYINGGTGMHFNGSGNYTCGSVTFYAATGDIGWNGGTTINLSAPTGGPYAHVLMYLPYGNSSALTIEGNSYNQLTGSIIAVSSPITINGNSGTFALNSQITGYTVQVGGNGTVQIDYHPEDQYSQTDPTVIQLTK